MRSEIQTISALVRQIRELILAARKAAAQAVDRIQVVTCFEIGRRIVEQEQIGAQRAEYGKALFKKLAASLTDEFGRGFSRSNLQSMRKFYLTYRDRLPEKCQMPSGKFTKAMALLPSATNGKPVQMYVNYFDQQVRTADENPIVGIILCKKKHDALVEITLPKEVNIFASQYQLFLPSKEELKQKLLDWTEEAGGERT